MCETLVLAKDTVMPCDMFAAFWDGSCHYHVLLLTVREKLL